MRSGTPIAAPHLPVGVSEITMNVRMIALFGVAWIAASLSGCGSMSGRDRNTATGALIGGAAGAVLTGGSTTGTIGGAAVGGVIGHAVDPKK